GLPAHHGPATAHQLGFGRWFNDELIAASKPDLGRLTGRWIGAPLPTAPWIGWLAEQFAAVQRHVGHVFPPLSCPIMGWRRRAAIASPAKPGPPAALRAC